MARRQRVLLMIEHFKEDFDSGMTVDEIEKKYGVSKCYSYSIMDEIAKFHNVGKEYFYRRNHGSHIILNSEGRIIPKRASFEEIRKSLDEAEKTLASVEENINNLTAEMNEMLLEMER